MQRLRGDRARLGRDVVVPLAAAAAAVALQFPGAEVVVAAAVECGVEQRAILVYVSDGDAVIWAVGVAT